MSETTIHPDLTKADMENTRAMLQGLLDEFRRQERERQLLAAAVTWVNAFSSFKKLRKRVGLPKDQDQKLYYGAFLGSLKAAGKMLLVWFSQSKVDPSIVGLKIEDLRACVDELVEDDRHLDSGALDTDLSEFEAKYCVA